MTLLNYTTQVEAAKTVNEIQRTLATHGARAILLEYDGDGHIEALSFKVNTSGGEMPFRLPMHPEAVLKVMERQSGLGRIPHRFVNHPQAVRVAWRIVKDWVEAQMAIIETEMVRLEQVFLPYAVTPTGQTLYEALVESKFKALKAPEEEPTT